MAVGSVVRAFASAPLAYDVASRRVRSHGGGAGRGTSVRNAMGFQSHRADDGARIMEGMRFSSRVDISDPNPIATAEAAARADGIALGKLNDSNPTRHGLAPVLVPEVYTADPRGPRAAREALAAFLSGRAAADGGGERVAVDPDRLYLLSSTSQAYSWLIKLLCDPGDLVLAPKPGYPLIESIARLEGVGTLEYQLQFDGSWFIDLGALEELLDGPEGSRIRALVLINPNNPSGSYVKPGERGRIVGMCREHGVALIADEVFYEYSLEPFEGNARLAGERGALTFALDGFSKMLAAPHAKVGWIEVSGPDDDVAEAMRRLDFIADDYLPMSDIIAMKIPELLAAAPGQLALVKGRVRGNLARLHELLDADESGLVSVLRAEGGWNVLLHVPATLDENELVLSLIDGHRLTGQPGYFFDMTSNGYLAVSLLPEDEEFERNIRAVLDTVASMCA